MIETEKSSAVTGRFDIPYLYSYWQRSRAGQAGPRADDREWDLENTLLSGLGLNLLETGRFLYSPRNQSFESFEQWIVEINNGWLNEERLGRLRDALAGKQVSSPAGSLDAVPGLTAEERAYWEEHGYLVVRNAAEPEDCATAAAAIYEAMKADPADPDTWYGGNYGHSIWVPLLHHPAVWKNRNAPRLVKAFAELWGREDLWPTVDQCGFNPPERESWRFPGPHLHWDMTLTPPLCFGVQGILYLTDTPADQGAFCCIPGFHRKLASWLAELPPGEEPRKAIFNHPGLTPIAGKAGDLVLWHHALPHGSSPNRGKNPRVVQYIQQRPTRWAYTAKWS